MKTSRSIEQPSEYISSLLSTIRNWGISLSSLFLSFSFTLINFFSHSLALPCAIRNSLRIFVFTIIRYSSCRSVELLLSSIICSLLLLFLPSLSSKRFSRLPRLHFCTHGNSYAHLLSSIHTGIYESTLRPGYKCCIRCVVRIVDIGSIDTTRIFMIGRRRTRRRQKENITSVYIRVTKRQFCILEDEMRVNKNCV